MDVLADVSSDSNRHSLVMHILESSVVLWIKQIKVRFDLHNISERCCNISERFRNILERCCNISEICCNIFSCPFNRLPCNVTPSLGL